MSEQTNVQIVQDAYTAFGRGDIRDVLSRLDENVEWIIPGPSESPVTGIRHGRAEVGEFFRALEREQDQEAFTPQRFIADDEVVAVIGYYRWRIKGTGRTTESEWVHLFTVRDGKIARFQEYSDTASYADAYRGSTRTVAVEA